MLNKIIINGRECDIPEKAGCIILEDTKIRFKEFYEHPSNIPYCRLPTTDDPNKTTIKQAPSNQELLIYWEKPGNLKVFDSTIKKLIINHKIEKLEIINCNIKEKLSIGNEVKNLEVIGSNIEDLSIRNEVKNLKIIDSNIENLSASNIDGNVGKLKIINSNIEDLSIRNEVKNLKVIGSNIENLSIDGNMENLEISKESKIQKFESNSKRYIRDIKITDSILCLSYDFTFIYYNNDNDKDENNGKDKARIGNIFLESGAKIYNYPIGVKESPANSLMITKNSNVYPWGDTSKKINFEGDFHNDIEQFSPDDKESKLLSLRRLYQMLKRQANDRQDDIQAWFFYSRELKAHQMVLSLETSEGKPHIRNDKIILWFNRHTNNFGLSWERPLGLLIAINLFASLLLLSGKDFLCYSPSSLCAFCCNCVPPYWVCFLKVTCAFTQFLNTFFQLFDIVNGQKVFEGKGNHIEVLGIFHRFILAYLYYSMIIAFRRFSRKP